MKLIIIQGPGGSGKTTVANILANKLRESGKAALIESDTFYWGISGEEHDDNVVFEGLQNLEELYLSKGYDVIIAGIMTSMHEGKLRIENLIRTAEKYEADIKVFYLKISIDESLKRISQKFKEEGWDFNENESREWFNRSESRRYDGEIEIDAESLSPEEIYEKIVSML